LRAFGGVPRGSSECRASRVSYGKHVGAQACAIATYRDGIKANPETEAFRENVADVGATLQNAVDSGQQSAQTDAHDFVETLMAIADRLEPPVRP
jgi:hypothetical protein